MCAFWSLFAAAEAAAAAKAAAAAEAVTAASVVRACNTRVRSFAINGVACLDSIAWSAARASGLPASSQAGV